MEGPVKDKKGGKERLKRERSKRMGSFSHKRKVLVPPPEGSPRASSHVPTGVDDITNGDFGLMRSTPR